MTFCKGLAILFYHNIFLESFIICLSYFNYIDDMVYSHFCEEIRKITLQDIDKIRLNNFIDMQCIDILVLYY